jgi:hypothetical protein
MAACGQLRSNYEEGKLWNITIWQILVKLEIITKIVL